MGSKINEDELCKRDRFSSQFDPQGGWNLDKRKWAKAVPAERKNCRSKMQRQQRTDYMQSTVVPSLREVLRAEASEAKKVGYIRWPH